METFETFKKIDAYYKSQLVGDEPTCYNGMVRVRKYKITIEKIEEPDDVIIERLQKMWDESENPHHWEPIKAEGLKYGVKFSHNTRLK